MSRYTKLPHETTDRFLGQLESFADGMRAIEPNAAKVHEMAAILERMVREFRIETAPTKRNLMPVKIAGEDAYDVTL
jgi:hypothetical protein